MIDLVKNNKEKIKKFDINFYFEQKNYQMASAISALLTTNEIQECFLKEENNLNKGDYALRLYALLQSLFVSIDSLYAVAYALTKSKSFININANADLRLLRYIRNDVVGHPSNRVVSDNLAFCILDDNSITKESFDYYVYSKKTSIKKTVIINDILKSYYLEANSLLDNLYEIANSSKTDTIFEELIDKIINNYMHDLDYIDLLDDLMKEYKKLYPDAKMSQHRILWRYDVIKKLYAYNCKNDDQRDVINHCIGIEIFKLYELVNNTAYSVSMNKKNPKYISQTYRMLNKNKDLSDMIVYLKNCDHPLFYQSICKFYNTAARFNNKSVVEYLKMIKDAYKNRRDEVLYGLVLPFRKYLVK